MSYWKPIETAPRDGTAIIGCYQGFMPTGAYWNKKKNRWEDYDHVRVELTHWLPLPELPKKS